ncbi:MAG: hypothetical protein EPO07_08430, partial [Verrucomicrobia bacterium]
FELAILLALTLIGWAAFRLYEIVPEADRGRQQLRELQGEYSAIGSYVQTNARLLSATLTNILQKKDSAATNQFERQSQEFKQWIADEERRREESRMEAAGESSITNEIFLSQQQLLSLLGRIRAAQSNYLDAAHYLINNAGQPLLGDRLAAHEWATRRELSRLLTFARLARLRSQAMDLVLAGSEGGYKKLQERFRHLRFALLLVLVGMCFLFIFAIYRRKISRTRALIREHGSQYLEQQAKLAKLAHFGEFAHELAHEIKQPLTAINARLYTLQKTLASGTNAHKDAAVIRNEINRLDRIVKDFLALARPADPKLAPLEAAGALEEIRDLMASQFAAESIELKLDCEDTNDLQVLGDSEQLKQVLINLVKNAAESLDHEGTVTLRAKKGERSLKNGSTEAVIIEVEDTGPGIPPEIQTKIFDPFFSTKGDGTGLGLAIAARIVDQHGGILEFDTDPGRGTVFRIALPACRKEQMA